MKKILMMISSIILAVYNQIKKPKNNIEKIRRISQNMYICYDLLNFEKKKFHEVVLFISLQLINYFFI